MATRDKANTDGDDLSKTNPVVKPEDEDKEEDEGIGVMNVSKEDQQMINKFARLNARYEDAREEIAFKTNELKNYEDAVQETELKILEDLDDKLHLSVGDIMVNLTAVQIQEWLEKKIEATKKLIESLETEKEATLEQMNELKANLYAKFGQNIHLEPAT